MHSKGSLYALESAIAIMMMITAMALLLRTPLEPQEFSEYNHKIEVYNALEISDDLGTLRINVMNDDADSIETEIDGYISSSVQFGIVIFDGSTNITEIPLVDPSFTSVITTSYFISGQVGDYNPREVRAYIWGFD